MFEQTIQEIPVFFEKHPIVTVVLALSVLGWAGTLIGAVVAPCNK